MTVDLPKVFFSYARADAEFVLKLANDLRSAGISLWIDQLDIRPGERWDSAVENALKASPCLLVVLSPASVASQNVMDEVAFALENNKTVVPVLHTRCVIPFRIQRLQYIDFTATYNNGLTRLLGALNAVQPSQATHAFAQASRAGAAAPGTARSQPRLQRWLIYPLVAGSLAAVVGISYWVSTPKHPADDCIPPYVWRLTIPSDHVCVTEASRKQVELENQRAAERRQPGGQGASGADTCVSGYVWREAFDGDTICVSVPRREQIREENALAPERIKR
jgi:hypothetical protein